MNNLIISIEKFPIYIFFIFKNLTCHDFYHFLQLIFHFKLKPLNFSLIFLINHMFKDIYNVIY
jgi:hypothetical protein